MKYRRHSLTIALRWLAYAGLLLVCMALQTTPRFLQLGSAKPVFVIPVCLAVAVYEGEFLGALVGAVGGLLWDAAAGRVGGYFAIMLLIACFLAGCLYQQYLRDNPLNFAWVCAVTVWVALSLDFIMSYYLRGYPGAAYWYLGTLMPMCGLTVLVGWPVRLLARCISRIRMHEPEKK